MSLFDFLEELRVAVDGDLRTDQISRVLYSTDASIYQVMPHAVLIPQTIGDVQTAVSLAAKYNVAILPRTAGSSLVGQAVNEALVIDFTRHLNAIIELNVEEQWVRVQPGIVLDELNAYLRPHGLQFGPDPASSNRAAMGGIVSNNSTGSHSIMYGMTADHVLGMDVILSDGTTAVFTPISPAELPQYGQRPGLEGAIYRQIQQLVESPVNQEIVRTGTPRHWRRCGGYNLDRFVSNTTFNWPKTRDFNLSSLVCGGEGTLAVMTEIKLNLVPLPQMTALAIVHFNDLQTALTAVPIILETKPSVVELLDNLGLTLCRDVPEYARLLDGFIEGTPNCVLITEFYGESDGELQAKVERLTAHLQTKQAGHIAIISAFAKPLQADIWKVRKVGLGLLMSIKGDYKPIPFIEDAAVPVEHLAEYIDKLERFCNDLGTDVAYYAHASAGCLHVRPLINAKVAAEVAKLPQITDFSVDLLRGYGGSFSSEHGDGRARSWLNEKFFGPELYGLYKQVKVAFDPHNILNPGNIVNAGAMIENLRYGAEYATVPFESAIDFSDDLGFHRAVEMCNGAAVCRKRTADTMCPSFMVTREEEHSTRGRANLLRAALSGTLPASAMTDERLYEAMELCVSCKACKAECPSSVDMAKIKVAYLANYYEANGVPLRARLFANFGKLMPLGTGAMAPLANGLMRNPVVRTGMEKWLGIGRKRPFPAFAHQSFTKWWVSNHSRLATRDSPLVLFVDPFTNYNTPEVAVAAVEVLAATGFEIVVVAGDDGRPAISKGLVKEATAAAKKTIAQLAPYAERNIPIVGLEPSSLLTLRDEYLYLLKNDARVKPVAAQAFTFEEFLAKLADDGALSLTFTDVPKQILLHGHCHQKALVGTKPSHRVLSLPPNYTVEEVNAGCCGMAGTFGYEAEHYALSMKMGERGVLTAVSAADENTIVAAAGLSCREQIKHGTSRRALHPAEILRDALM